MAKTEALDQFQVDHLIELGEASDHCDGLGLYLCVVSSSSASWKYRFKIDGKRRNLGLGSALVVTLAQARQLAQEAREKVSQGVNPISASKAARAKLKAEQSPEKLSNDQGTNYSVTQLRDLQDQLNFVIDAICEKLSGEQVRREEFSARGDSETLICSQDDIEEIGNTDKKLRISCYTEGKGLYLMVYPTGKKSFIGRYWLKGKSLDIVLGKAHLMSLKDAQEKHIEGMRMASKGIDPREEWGSEL